MRECHQDLRFGHLRAIVYEYLGESSAAQVLSGHSGGSGDDDISVSQLLFEHEVLQFLRTLLQLFVPLQQILQLWV